MTSKPTQTTVWVLDDQERATWIDVFTAEGIDPQTVTLEPPPYVDPITGKIHYVARIREPGGGWKTDAYGLVKEAREFTPTMSMHPRFTRRVSYGKVVVPADLKAGQIVELVLRGDGTFELALPEK